MRLIDADALIKNYEMSSNRHDKSELCGVSYKDFFDTVIYDVSHAPTVEPKRGQWEVGGKICGLDYPQCSLCKTWVDIPSPYCPHCGAKMDGVEDV